MSTDAQKRASTNYNRKQDNIMVRPSKEEGATIRAAAAGKSVQGYMLEAVREKMERERAGAVPGGVPAGAGKKPEWGTAEWFAWIQAEAKRREQAQQQGAPTVGSNEWWAERRPKQPHEGVGDGSTGEQFPYFPDDEETPHPVVGAPPMQPDEELPEENEEDLP